jgi:hypothetical protein
MADENNITTLAKRLRPLLGGYVQNLAGLLLGEGPGIDVVKSGNLNTVGLGGDTILLYNSNLDPVEEFPVTDAGLTAALAAASSGDIVLLPSSSIAGDHTIPGEVSVAGMERQRSILTGKITMEDLASLWNLSVLRTADDSNPLYAVTSTSGTSYLYNCTVFALQSGNGYSAALYEDGGILESHYCKFKATIGGSDSNPFRSSTAVDEIIASDHDDTKCLALWNGGGNDAPPSGWYRNSFDDSGWAAAIVPTDYGTFGTAFPGTEGLWNDADEATNLEEVLLRQTFDLSFDESTFVSATFLFRADDLQLAAYINGHYLGNELTPSTEDNLGPDLIVNIPIEYLNSTGTNVIAVHVRNSYTIPISPAWGAWKLEIHLGNPENIKLYACQFDNISSVVFTESMPGDRAAFDAQQYSEFHANDIDTSLGIHHTLGEGEYQAAPGNHSHDDAIRGIYLMAAFDEDDDNSLYLLVSDDGITWTDFTKKPVYTEATIGLRDPSISYFNNKWWVVHTNYNAPFYQFRVISSDDLNNWTLIATLDAQTLGVGSAALAWAPEWFVDDDGSIHLFVAISPSDHLNHKIYETHPTNSALTTWSNLVEITGTDFPTSMIDPFMVKIGDTYYFWYKDEVTTNIEYATSTNLTSDYVRQEDGNWAGWGSLVEGESLVRVNANTWRIYYDKYVQNSIFYSESSDNFVTWTAGVQITASWIMTHPTVLYILDLAAYKDILNATLITPGSGASALDDLTDVNAPAPNDQDVLTWDDGAGEWIAQAPPAGGATALDDLTNVNVPAPNDNDILSWDNASGKWINVAPVAPGTQYRQFLYDLDGLGDFMFITDDDGNPLMGLMDLE